MHSETTIYRFGPYELDAGRRRLSRGDEPILLPRRAFDVLRVLLARNGQFVSNDDLIATAWDGAATTTSNLEVAIWNLRKRLHTRPDGMQYIENRHRQGYRVSVSVERIETPPPIVSLDAVLEPYGAFIDGRAAVELLYLDTIAMAKPAFAEVLATRPDHVGALIGTAYARILEFESTRDDAVPDWEALDEALACAERACRLDPSHPEACSALAFAAHRHGDVERAVRAVRLAIEIQPTN